MADSRIFHTMRFTHDSFTLHHIFPNNIINVTLWRRKAIDSIFSYGWISILYGILIRIIYAMNCAVENVVVKQNKQSQGNRNDAIHAVLMCFSNYFYSIYMSIEWRVTIELILFWIFQWIDLWDVFSGSLHMGTLYTTKYKMSLEPRLFWKKCEICNYERV